jgi:hypothetical protein
VDGFPPVVARESEYFAGFLKAIFFYSRTHNITCIGYFATGKPKFNIHKRDLFILPSIHTTNN